MANDAHALRWIVPSALLGAEYLLLSVLVDLPVDGPALGLADVVRTALPVVIAAVAAGWLLARHHGRRRSRELAAPLPRWRPWPALIPHFGAYAAMVLLASRSLGRGASGPAPGALALLLACAAATVLLALLSAAPLGWLVRMGFTHWKIPLLAVAAGLLAWRAAAAAEELWGGLAEATLRAVAWLLERLGGDVTLEPPHRLIGLNGYEIRIAPVCSGVDGLGLVFLFQAVWISLARERLRLSRALVMLPIGAVAALVANVLRLTVLIWVGAAGHVELADGGLHSKLGWLLFVAIALASVALAERIPWLQRTEPAGALPDEGLPAAAAAFVAPLLAALTVALVTSMWAEGSLDLAYGARIGAAGLVLLAVRRSLPRPAFSWAWIPGLLAAGVCALWIALSTGEGQPLADALAGLPPAVRWSWIAGRVAGFCLVIPVVEELAFRGFLLPWLVSPAFERLPPRAWTLPAVVLSSLAFGALHQHWLLGTVAGLAFGVARLHRGRLSDAVMAHGLCNAGITAAVLLGGRWDLWM